MITNQNHPVAEKLRKGGIVSASWVQTGSNISSEILAEAGYDVIVADMEHSPLSLEKLVGILQSAKVPDVSPLYAPPGMTWSS